MVLILKMVTLRTKYSCISVHIIHVSVPEGSYKSPRILLLCLACLFVVHIMCSLCCVGDCYGVPFVFQLVSYVCTYITVIPHISVY